MSNDEKRKSRGFVFVCFSISDAATKAVTEMNGKMMDGKPLYVALAQRKEQRRAALEARHAQRGKLGGPGGPMPPQPMFPPHTGPMYFNQGPHGGPRHGGANFMYPGPMGGRGWMGPMPGHPMPMGRAPMAYQLMPVPGPGTGARGGERGPMGPGAGGPGGGRPPRTGPGAGGPGGGGPPGGRGGGRGVPGAPGAPTGAPGTGGPPRTGAGAGAGVPSVGQPGGYNLSANVRNPQQGRAPVPTATTEAPEPAIGATPTSATAPLTIKTLAAAPEKQKKQMIGEQLFPLIKQRQPDLAGKITGMLLEMDNGELIHLLESTSALQDKIAEAMAVLSAHQHEQADEEEGEATE